MSRAFWNIEFPLIMCGLLISRYVVLNYNWHTFGNPWLAFLEIIRTVEKGEKREKNREKVEHKPLASVRISVRPLRTELACFRPMFCTNCTSLMINLLKANCHALICKLFLPPLRKLCELLVIYNVLNAFSSRDLLVYFLWKISYN